MKNSRYFARNMVALSTIIIGLLSCKILSEEAILPTATLKPAQASTLPEEKSLPTITLLALPPDIENDLTSQPYDDFEDKQYDGAYDTSHFSVQFEAHEACFITQENGVLRIRKNPEYLGFSECSLATDRPFTLKYDRLEDMYSSILLGSDHENGIVSSMLVFDARFDDLKVNWLAKCGLMGFDNGPFAIFAVFHKTKPDSTDIVHYEELSLNYDQWYRFGFEINHETSFISCRVDGQEFGRYSLKHDPYSVRLFSDRYFRAIHNGFDEGSAGTILLDDLYLEVP